MRPDERTTPAGRFVAERGRNALCEVVIWVDYAAAVSLRRVRATNPKERRLERLATPGIDDDRISYGCINVARGLLRNLHPPRICDRRAIDYVLPEVKPVQQIFGFYGVAAARGLESDRQTGAGWSCDRAAVSSIASRLSRAATLLGAERVMQALYRTLPP